MQFLFNKYFPFLLHEIYAPSALIALMKYQDNDRAETRKMKIFKETCLCIGTRIHNLLVCK